MNDRRTTIARVARGAVNGKTRGQLWCSRGDRKLLACQRLTQEHVVTSSNLLMLPEWSCLRDVDPPAASLSAASVSALQGWTITLDSPPGADIRVQSVGL